MSLPLNRASNELIIVKTYTSGISQFRDKEFKKESNLLSHANKKNIFTSRE